MLKNGKTLYESLITHIRRKIGHTMAEVINMNNENEKNKKEQMEYEENKFNSVTQSVKPRNQNQQHNARREAIAPINQKR